MYIEGIILAAGKSSRMGENKLQLKIENTTIVEKVIENARASMLDNIMIITGKYDIETDIKKLYNPQYEKGISTAVKLGIKNCKGDAVMILLGDMPFVTVEVINNLYMGFSASDRNIAVPTYNGKRGNPVIIGKKYFQQLLNNTGDKGARDIIASNLQDVEFVEVQSDSIFLDIDDKDTYNALRK